METVTPLCSPELAEHVREIGDLTGEMLIQSDLKRLRWPDWFAANGMDPLVPHGMRFDRSFLAIAAACDGLGVALEFTRLAEREIQNGRLVAPFAGRAKDVEEIGHFLVFPRAERQRLAVRAFSNWLLDALGLPRKADEDVQLR